jgi:oligosaccharide repeat unit polymerase
MWTEMTSLIFFLVASIWFLRGAWRRDWDPLAPDRLYGTVWLLAVSLTNLHLSALQMQWTLFSWVYILGSILSYLAGVWLTRKSVGDQAGKGVYARVRDVIEPKRYLWAVFSLYVFCLAGYLWRIRSVGSVPALAENVEEARWRFYDIENGSFLDRFTANIAFLFSGVVIACALFYLLRKRSSATPSRKPGMLAILLLGSAVLFLISTTFRGAILPPLIIVGALFHYLRRNFSLARLALIGVITFSAGLGLVIYRHLSSPGYNLETAYTLAEMRIPPEYALVAEPYTYVALSMDNIIQLFERPLQPTLGILSFRPLWTALGLKNMLLRDVNLPFLPAFGFNTATYLYPFYEDFGLVGILVFPFAFGWVCGKVYWAMLTSGRVVYVLAYCFVVFLIIFSVLDNLFVFTRFWVELGLLTGVVYVARIGEKSGPPKGLMAIESAAPNRSIC